MNTICLDPDCIEGNPIRVLQWNVLSQGKQYITVHFIIFLLCFVLVYFFIHSNSNYILILCYSVRTKQ